MKIETYICDECLQVILNTTVLRLPFDPRLTQFAGVGLSSPLKDIMEAGPVIRENCFHRIEDVDAHTYCFECAGVPKNDKSIDQLKGWKEYIQRR